jgi:serine protease Do
MDNMDDILLLNATERYMKGEMTTEELSFFEELRKTNADIDQLVVEHTFFINELEGHAQTRAFKHSLYEVETKLTEEGMLNKAPINGKAKLVQLWKRYKRTAAVAASIAGLISIGSAGMMVFYNQSKDKESYKVLVNEIKQTKNEVAQIKDKQNGVANPVKLQPKVNFMATGFLVDGNGYIITNAHVITPMKKNIYVENKKGEYYKAIAVSTDLQADLVILKIVDTSFVVSSNLPYSIKKTNSDLGEQIFTLGFPRREIVYGAGYLSAKSGQEGDSTAYQLTIPANPGNSGGPVINSNGEIIGVITGRNINADGVTYATKSKNILRMIEELRKTDKAYQNMKMPSGNSLRGLDRVKQIKKLEDYIFMVVGN